MKPAGDSCFPYRSPDSSEPGTAITTADRGDRTDCPQLQSYWHDEHPDAAGPDLEGIRAMGALGYVQIHAIDEVYNQRLGTARGGEDDLDVRPVAERSLPDVSE